MDADNYETDPCLKEIRRAENYSWMDIVTIHKDKLPNYEEKVGEALLSARVSAPSAAGHLHSPAGHGHEASTSKIHPIPKA